MKKEKRKGNKIKIKQINKTANRQTIIKITIAITTTIITTTTTTIMSFN